MPDFFSDGNTPSRRDGMWVIEQKILGALIDGNGDGGGNAALEPAAGSGSPEGVVSGSPGKIYTDVDTSNLWNKVTGTGNTGWVQQTTV